MARVWANVIVGGESLRVLFDTNVKNTYITGQVASQLPVFNLDEAEYARFGKEVHEVKKECLVKCVIDGFPIRTRARVVERIEEDEKGETVDVLIGTLTMQEWGIIPVADDKRLDMSHCPRKFVEYC